MTLRYVLRVSTPEQPDKYIQIFGGSIGFKLVDDIAEAWQYQFTKPRYLGDPRAAQTGRDYFAFILCGLGYAVRTIHIDLHDFNEGTTE